MAHAQDASFSPRESEYSGIRQQRQMNIGRSIDHPAVNYVLGCELTRQHDGSPIELFTETFVAVLFGDIYCR